MQARFPPPKKNGSKQLIRRRICFTITVRAKYRRQNARNPSAIDKVFILHRGYRRCSFSWAIKKEVYSVYFVVLRKLYPQAYHGSESSTLNRSRRQHLKAEVRTVILLSWS